MTHNTKTKQTISVRLPHFRHLDERKARGRNHWQTPTQYAYPAARRYRLPGVKSILKIDDPLRRQQEGYSRQPRTRPSLRTLPACFNFLLCKYAKICKRNKSFIGTRERHIFASHLAWRDHPKGLVAKNITENVTEKTTRFNATTHQSGVPCAPCADKWACMYIYIPSSEQIPNGIP